MVGVTARGRIADVHVEDVMDMSDHSEFTRSRACSLWGACRRSSAFPGNDA